MVKKATLDDVYLMCEKHKVRYKPAKGCPECRREISEEISRTPPAAR